MMVTTMMMMMMTTTMMVMMMIMAPNEAGIKEVEVYSLFSEFQYAANSRLCSWYFL